MGCLILAYIEKASILIYGMCDANIAQDFELIGNQQSSTRHPPGAAVQSNGLNIETYSL
jgi:hypothetical protein